MKYTAYIMILFLFGIFAYADINENVTHFYPFDRDSKFSDTVAGGTNMSFNFSGTGGYRRLNGSQFLLGNSSLGTFDSVTCTRERIVSNLNGTISFWVLIDVFNGGGFNERYVGANDTTFFLIWTPTTQNPNPKARFQEGDEFTDFGVITKEQKWTMVTLTYNHSGYTLYWNLTQAEARDISSWTDYLDTHYFCAGSNEKSETGDGVRGNIDNIAFWNRHLSYQEVKALYNNGTGISFPFYQSPTLRNVICPACPGGLVTSDTTPTLNVTSVDYDGTKMVRISNDSTLNFTSAGSSRDCSQGPTNVWTCTVIASDALSEENPVVYFWANDTLGHYHITYNLSATMDFSGIQFRLDGQNNSRYYEYETTANLSTQFEFITIFDDTSRFLSATPPINYLIDILRWPISNHTVATDENFNFTIDDRTELYRARFNITAVPSAGNLTINQSTSYIYFPGELQGSRLQQNQFIFLGTPYWRFNLSFPSAESRTIEVNFSSQGNHSRTGFFNFTITAAGLDKGNEFDRIELIQTDANTTDVFNNGTFYPIGDILGLNNTYDNLAKNRSGRWKGQGVFTDSNAGCRSDETFDGDTYCIRDAGDLNGVGNEIYNDFIDAGQMNYITAQTYMSCHCVCQQLLEFTDLDNSVTIDNNQQGNCPSSQASEVSACNYTMERSGTTWTIDGVGTGCFDGDVPTDTLERPYYLRMRYVSGQDGTTSNFYDMFIKNINYGGIYLNISNGTFSGKQGSHAAQQAGNFTTHILNETPGNVIRATLTANAFIPTNTEVNYYLSNDNGATFESVTNGSSHLFSSSGTQIRARFEVISTDNFTTPIVTDYRVTVTSTAISSLDIDVGSDGDIDVSFPNELNGTTTPTGFGGNSSSVNNYILENCFNDSVCTIPITFTAGSGGTLEIDNFNLTENINPVRANISNIQNLNEIIFLNQFDGGNIIQYDDIQFDYRGSKNISVSAHSSDWSDNINHTLYVVYSPFNLTFPSGANFWELFPSARNQSDIEPFGQNDSDGIWRVKTGEYHDENVSIYVRYNQSIESCVSRMNFLGQNYSLNKSARSMSLNVSNLSTSGQKIEEGLNNSVTGDIWTYTDILCSDTTVPFLIPYFCFFSACQGCTLTQDIFTDCDVVE